MTAKSDSVTIQKDFAPFLVWHRYFYKQQKEFNLSAAWQRWFVAGNGTGKSLLIHWNALAYGYGMHPHQDPVMAEKLGIPVFPPPPLRIRILVPDFEKVKDFSLPKLCDPQIINYLEGGEPLQVSGRLYQDIIILC